jgi:CheY-like chemotaxis protein
MTPDPSTSAPHILLVEDDENEVVLARRALRERGAATVISVTRAAQAVEYLDRRGEFEGRDPVDPSLIILDLGLPDGSGLDVLDHLQRDPAKRHIPVVVLSVSDRDADRQASYAAGASVFVQKPVQLQDFLATMRAIGRYWLDLQRRDEGQPDA